MNRADRDLANETSVSGKVDDISHLPKEVAPKYLEFLQEALLERGGRKRRWPRSVDNCDLPKSIDVKVCRQSLTRRPGDVRLFRGKSQEADSLEVLP